MRVVAVALLMLCLWSAPAVAESAIGPWGMSLNKTQQASAPAGILSGQQREAMAIRHLKPTVIRNQNYYCVPYVRAVSGIAIRGNAWTWWQRAKGVYERGQRPEIGSVIVMKKIRSMRLGHVATVSSIISDRLIQVDHANWVRGEVHRGALVKDVSEANDWSRVRVWYPPRDDFGTTRYPVYGFVYPRPAAN